jgi:hypothetical protein
MSVKNPKNENKSNGDLSALIEMRPKEIDDRTSAIDPIELKRAKKEALLAQKVARKSNPGRSRLSRRWKLSGLVLGIGFLLGLTVMAWQSNGASPSDLSSKVLTGFDRLFSPLPTLEDVSAEDYRLLKKAASSSSFQDSAIVLSEGSRERPVFYVTSSLPEGTVLSFYLHTLQESLLVENLAPIQFQMILTKKMAKSNSVHSNEGADLPIGEYQVILTEEEEEPALVKSFLSSLPDFEGNLPKFIPRGKKVFITKNFFLGGKKDSVYLDALARKKEERAVQRKIENQSLQTELAEIQNWLNAEAKFILATQTLIKGTLLGIKPPMKASQIHSYKKRQWLSFSKSIEFPLFPKYQQSSKILSFWIEADQFQKELSTISKELQNNMVNQIGPENSKLLPLQLQQLDALILKLRGYQVKLQAATSNSIGVNSL